MSGEKHEQQNVLEEMLAFADTLQEELVEVRRDLHRHPELLYNTDRTSGIVIRLLEEWGVEVIGNVGPHFGKGVVGTLRGGVGKGPTILLRADMDALPAFRSTADAQHNQSPFTSLEDNIANGPALIGSPDQVIEKILNYQAAFGHQVLSLSVDGLTESEQREQMERFASDVAPVLRREVPSSVWEDSTLGLSNLLNA